jgi:hypothetical protein
MPRTKYNYAAEKLSAARYNLMAPHPLGEAQSFAGAFHECMLGFHDLRPDDFDSRSLSWYATIQQTMSTDGLEDSTGRGTWVIKAERLTVDEKLDFSRALNELTYWLESKSRGE